MAKDPMAVVEKAVEELKALRTEVSEKLTNHDELIQTIDKRLEYLETQLKKFKIPGLEEEMAKREFSLAKAFRGILFGEWEDAEFEKEVVEEATKRKDLAAGTPSAGGYIVPVQYIPQLIELIRAEAVVTRAGATSLDQLVGSPVDIPKQTGGAIVYWVGENTAITASDLAFGQLQLTPKTMAALMRVSNRLIRLANPSVETIIRRDFAQAIALELDIKALRGDGTGSTPVGIANTAGIKTVAIGANGGDFTFDHAIDMEFELAQANTLRGSLAFITHPAVIRKLKKLKATGTGDYMRWVEGLKDKQLVEYPYFMTTQLPTNLTKGTGTNLTEVYFGNWQELIVAQWTGIEIAASMQAGTSFETNQTWFRVIQDVDIGVRHPESFCLLNDASAV